MACTRVGLYTPNTPLEPIKKILGEGAGQDLGGLCPRPQPKSATAGCHAVSYIMITHETAAKAKAT